MGHLAKYDDTLFAMMQQHENEMEFLNTVFGFLQRKSSCFNGPKVSHPANTASIGHMRAHNAHHFGPALCLSTFLALFRVCVSTVPAIMPQSAEHVLLDLFATRASNERDVMESCEAWLVCRRRKISRRSSTR